MEGMGKQLRPLWEWPELIPAELCLPDWLHPVDHGVGADIAGQILVELADELAARAFKERVALLWAEIRQLYKNMTCNISWPTSHLLSSTKSHKKTARQDCHPPRAWKYFLARTAHQRSRQIGQVLSRCVQLHGKK